MYLVDTSVWVDYLQGRESDHVELLDQLLDNPLAVGISDAIYLEILQGARGLESFERLRAHFSGQRFHRFADPEASHANAARIYMECRRLGVTVRSTLDCLIAQCAVEHDLILLHNDRAFTQMGRACAPLKQRHFLT